MTTTIPPYDAPFLPVPQVTPLSYRDGLTLLKKLDQIVRYINKDLVPFVNDNYAELAEAFEVQANALIAAVNAAIEEVLNGSIEVQDPIVAGLISDSESETQIALLALLNPIYVAKAGLDDDTALLLADLDSATATEIDTLTALWIADVDSAIRGELDTLLSGYEPISGVRGVTRTIYVRADGNDTTGDGLTPATAYREIRTAVASIAQFGPVIRGTIQIDVGVGTYKGGIQLPITRFRAQDDFIRINGPAVGGHPNVPLAVINYGSDTTYNYGIQALNGSTLWIEDLKFTGGFDIAVDVRVNSVLQSRNIHVDGQNVGNNGFSFLTHCTYDMRGGIIENLVEHGIQEHFGITRTFDNVTTSAGATTIRNCAVGLFAKEDCNGHLDYVKFDNNGTGLEFHAYTTANVKACTFTNNDVGIAIINSEVHNTAGVIWGTGVNVNNRRIVSYGNSDEIETWGWNGSNAATLATGHRPLKCVASTYTDTTITGSTTEVEAYQSPTIIPAGRLSVKGRHIKVSVWLSIVTAPTTNTRIVLRLGGQLLAQVPIPSTAVANLDMEVEFDVVCPADGNNQKCLGKVNGFIPGANAYTSTTINLSDADFSAAVGVIHTEAASSVTIRAIEVWA